MTNTNDFLYLMSLASSGDMIPEGSVSVDGRTISWKYTSSSINKMEVSASSSRMVYWLGWEWDTESMKTTWIGIGNPSTKKAIASTCRTSYALKDGQPQLVSMSLRRGFPIGEGCEFSLLDMVKEENFHNN
tara:strand:- start:21819 stop:22211 length:393 start_codon:yes stop_codon:yes gene_type:complete